MITEVETRRCIYCLERKREQEFNREHVLPEAFGRFENSPVLDCVCKDCNDFFGRDLELKFARDSVEGLLRFATGIKSTTEYKGIGRKATTQIVITDDGPMKGALCVLQPADDTASALKYILLPQVGLARSQNDQPDYFLLPDIPTKEEIANKGYRKGDHVYIKIWGTTRETALQALSAKGYGSFESDDAGESPAGRVHAEHVFKISHPEFRAVAKISFNFLASGSGGHIACMPNFNEIRRYIRDDVRPERSPVAIGRLARLHRPNGERVM